MRLLLGLALAACLAATPLAQDAPAGGTSETATTDNAPGEMSLWAQIGFYDHADNGDGNPFLDEALTVVEPVLVFDHQVNDDWGYALTFSYDWVSSASIDRLSAFPQQSGASGDNYFGLNYAQRHALDGQHEFNWNVGGSVEYDYTSIGAGVGYTIENPERGSTDSFTLNGYFDTVDIIRFSGDQIEGTDTRTSLTGTWTRSQPLTPKWTGTLSTLVSVQSGFLETPYNAVVLEDASLPANPNLDNNAQGIEVTEELPDTRLRGSVKLTGRRWMGEGKALELAGRLYGDDWGIMAVSLEPRWFWMLDEDMRLRLRYRYYTQTEADNFGDQFLGTVLADAPEFRTQDSDLAAFDSHTLGARLDLLERGRTKWSFDLNYTLREDGLDHLYASLGYRWSF